MTPILSTRFLIVLAILAFGKPPVVALIAWLAGVYGKRFGRIVPASPPKEQIALEKRSTYLVLTDPIVLILLTVVGVIRFAPDSVSNIAITFGLMFLWVDIWMYANHVAMHRIPTFARWHTHHHQSHVPHARSALSFSAMEKLVCYTLGWLLGAAALSRVFPISLIGIAVFYTFYFFASSLAHANVELLNRRASAGGFQLLGSSTTHALHHVQPGRNFAFFTTLYDRFFGTAASAEDYRLMQSMRGDR